MPNNFPKAIPDIKQSMKTISMFLRSKAIMFLLLIFRSCHNCCYKSLDGDTTVSILLYTAITAI